MTDSITFVKGGLVALWTVRKPTIAVFGPSVANEGYCVSSFYGSTHNSETDCPLPPYDSRKHNPGMPDTEERMEALQKLALAKLRPGDLALVKVEERHASGYYGYFVLPGEDTMEVCMLFPETSFEDTAPIPIVPHDMLTPLLKEAIMEMEKLSDEVGCGFGFATKLDDDIVEVNLGHGAWHGAWHGTWLRVPLKDGKLPTMIDYDDCIAGSWW